MSIEHRVELANGVVANTVGSTEEIAAMYPAWNDTDDLYFDSGVSDGKIVLFNGGLRFTKIDDDEIAITGNTVTRLCPIAADCGNCALAGSGLTVVEMSERNCARANTARTFENAGIDPEKRFVLLPVGRKSFVVSDSEVAPEYNGDQLMQNRLSAAPAVVFTKPWLKARGLDEIAIGMNGADGSMGVALTEINGVELIIPFCSMRGNMGDRQEEDQILRQALLAYFEHMSMSEDDRLVALASMKMTIELSASASLKNFAHLIQVPSEVEDAPEGQKKYAAKLRESYPDLIERAGGVITSAIVLNDQYPGAFNRGSIIPQLEAEMGIHTSPITPDNCPGDGQSCHIDYRRETKYALLNQLIDMGIPVDNIDYDDSRALDPGDPSNNMASNRAEQNNGVAAEKTNRTINGLVVKV